MGGTFKCSQLIYSNNFVLYEKYKKYENQISIFVSYH